MKEAKRFVTFEELSKLKPELIQIKSDAQDWFQHPDRWHHYEVLKRRVKMCLADPEVSRYADPMQDWEVYDVAYQAIFKEGQDLTDYDEENDEE